MNRPKSQLRVISFLMVVFLLFFSYGGLFGSVFHEQKAEAIDRFTVGSVAFYSAPIICALGVFYAVNQQNVDKIAASTVDAVKAKWQELLAAKGLTDQANTQLTNVYNNYDINLTFNWNLVSGGVLACLYDAIADVVFKTETNQASDNTYHKYFYYSNYIVKCDSNHDLTSFNNLYLSSGTNINGSYRLIKSDFLGSISISSADSLSCNLYHDSISNYNNMTGIILTDLRSWSMSGFGYIDGLSTTTINSNVSLLMMIVNNNNTIKNYTNYPLINNIDNTTITEINNGGDITIPTITNVTYDSTTNNWTSTNTNITIINRDAEPAPTPTPTPEPSPSPSPTVQPDTGEPTSTDTIDWLKAIFKQLVVINDNILLMMKDVVTDLVKLDTDIKTIETDISGNILTELKNINQSIKDLQSSGIGDATDKEKTGNWLLNFVTALLEFLKAAMVPTTSLNLASLNAMPSNLTAKFPFSIPSDIVHLLGIFQADPEPFNIQFTLPLSSFGTQDQVIAINDTSFMDSQVDAIRNLVFVGFIISLFWMSYNVLMGGDD